MSALLSRRTVIIVAVLSLVAVVIGAYLYVNRGQAPAAASQRLTPKGGEVWDQTKVVGVRVSPGILTEPVTVAFGQPKIPTPESELSKLIKVVVPATDIVPDRPLPGAEVVFKVDPGITANAGIQVFNENIGTWVPIPTRAEGDRLIAKAPHFSIYRAVVINPGTYVLKAGEKVINVIVTNVMKPIDVLWQTGFALAKDLLLNMLGQFDNAKFRCDPRNGLYQVTVNDATRQHKLDACVVKARDSNNTLLIKNGLALPFVFTPDGKVPGLGLTLTESDDIFGYAYNFVTLLLGGVAVSGLETGAFSMTADTPVRFAVNGQVSWAAAVFDMAMALATVMLPSSKTVAAESRLVMQRVYQRLSVVSNGVVTRINYRQIVETLDIVVRETRTAPTVAGQAKFILAVTNCAVSQGNKLKPGSPQDIVGVMVEAVQSCLEAASSLVNLGEFKDAVSLLSSITGMAKVLPETGQLAGLGIVNLFTGDDNSKVTFTVRRTNPALDVFVSDRWEYSCGDVAVNMTIRSDYTGFMTTKYPLSFNVPNPQYRTITMKFHLVVEAGKPTAIVDSYDGDQGIRQGDKFRLSLSRDGKEVTVARDGADGGQRLYRNTTGYC